MSTMPLVPLHQPTHPTGISAFSVALGPSIPAIERIKLFGDVQWEEFVLEWAHSLRSRYREVYRCGGAGDMGRDVVALSECDLNIWDNYQCKHYDHPLRPSEIWVELGKLAYYTHEGKYTLPRAYNFVAPQGAGTTLTNLLRQPEELKSGLVENWDKKCRNGITNRCAIDLDEELLEHIDRMDFGIFMSVPPLRLIEQHRQTPWHVARFGGGLPPRPLTPPPPAHPNTNEVTYISQLLEAYSDALGRHFGSIEDLVEEECFLEHLQDSRLEFYSAESLRSFSRDTLPLGEFERLQEEIHDGIRDDVRDSHENGFERVLAVVRRARSLQITAHALVSMLAIRDRGGICHQLANDGRIKWVTR